MFPLNLALAVCMITADPDHVDDKTVLPCFLSSLQSVAINLELLDEKAAYNWLRDEQSLVYDLYNIQGRYKNLRDAPSLADACRFPQYSICQENIEFNVGYSDWLNERAEIDKSYWICEAQIETRNLLSIWTAVRDIQYSGSYINVRRAALQDLRELIGPHMYYAGCLPSSVPVWRLQSRD
jgi:hypothetical protein